MDTKTLVNRKTRRTTLTLEADVADYVEKTLAADKPQIDKDSKIIEDYLAKNNIKATKGPWNCKPRGAR